MDLRAYYQKIRNTEADIADEHTVIVSLETGDGGTAGRMTEARRDLAARMVVEGRARLASEAEREEFRKAQQKRWQQARRREQASVQGGVLSEQDLKAIRNAVRPGTQD
jgi:hypothetical protein